MMLLIMMSPLLALTWQGGKHNEKRESYGHSLIIDPWGTVVGRLADPLATGIATAEVSWMQWV